MTKGRYNVSVPDGPNLKKGPINTDEAELESQECMDSCLNSSFIRSLSFHDRPRTSRAPPINKELHKSRYTALVSTSLENIPSRAFPPTDGRSEYSTRRSLGPTRVDKVEKTSHSNTNFAEASQIDQNQLLADHRLEDRYTRFGMGSEKLLKQTVAILRSVDEEISESLTNLLKPESIALESVIENYKKKDGSVKSSSVVFDSSKELSNEPIYENLQPSVHRTPKDEPVINKCIKKDERIASCCGVSEFLTKPSDEPIYENLQPFFRRTPKDGKVHPTPERLKDIRILDSSQNVKNMHGQIPLQSPKNIKAQSAEQRRKNLLPQCGQRSPRSRLTDSVPLTPRILQAYSTQKTQKNPHACIAQEFPKSLLTDSVQQSPKNSLAHSQQSPKNSLAHSQQSPKNSLVHSQERPKTLLAHSQEGLDNLEAPFSQSPNSLLVHFKKSPKNLLAHSLLSLNNLQDHFPQNPTNLLDRSQDSLDNLEIHFHPNPDNLEVHYHQNPARSQQSPENLLVQSAEQTLKNLESLLSSEPGNAQTSNKPDSNDPPYIKQSPKNDLSSSDNATAESSIDDFDLPSDHQQFVKIVGALQNRCLEYREMIQDVAVLVIEECLNFSDLSISRMRHLRKQFESLKKNFGDFKELCCKSVVFGPDSLPIDEKVTEVIQSFYLKLLQEENETFMARLEFGLKMAEIYARMLKYETEKKKVITTLEKEILYLKKTSVGFKV